MMLSFPIVKDLVLVGGGHSHVLLLRMLGMKPIQGLRITLISPDYLTPYSGMLPGVVAGHYTTEDIHIDLIPLCRFAGAEFIQARVEDIDPYSQRVEIQGRPSLEYDALSLDIGITPNLDIPGASEHVIPVKPIGEFLKRWQLFLERLNAGQVSSVAVVGAGAGGVELTLAIHEHISKQSNAKPDMHLIAASDVILPGYHPDVQVRLRQRLLERKIEIHLGARVRGVTKSAVLNDFGGEVLADEVFWVTSAASQSWLGKTGLELDESGFVAIKPTLQSTNFDSVFAAGDIAQNSKYPRPKAGVFAVRQGPILYQNIRRYLLGQTPKAYKPQTQFLSLVSTGGRSAVATKGRYRSEGGWVWRWKDWIDHRFMDKFRDLPRMKPEPRKGLLADLDEQMRCGGCGSKVSAGLLSEVLQNSGVSPASLDDAAIFVPPAGKVMLHTVDTFKAFTADTFTFARISVHHALSDIYAMGGEPVTALAIMTVPYGTPRKIRATLEQLVAGSREALAEEGVALVGGHTTEGAEMSLGFAVNGVATESQLMKKQGLVADQCLILTKPLGTGAILAADMQHCAKGSWVQSALGSMDQSNSNAASIFTQHGVVACTDVTGFGLAGHLLEMLKASKSSAVINVESLPCLSGAIECLNDLRIKSTLHDSNKAACIDMTTIAHPSMSIVFDPQTSGGLLAAVNHEHRDEVLAALHQAGYTEACQIGRVSSSGTAHLYFE
ncbi:MAG: selenide,water dikinase [Candidatus Azotimanducaceae bacterium]|jgi:selenide,water dikinase